MQILQSIQVNRVHTVHEALALLDTLGSSMQVRQAHQSLVSSHVLQIKRADLLASAETACL